MKSVFVVLFSLFGVYANEQFELINYHGIKNIVVGEKHITILTPSYKNADWYKKNLDSIFNQQYSNYSLIYIDDCSPDGTGWLVEDYIKMRQPKCDVILIKNKKRVTALLNLYRAIHMAHPSDILVTVDGDDWLAHEHVLEKINKTYADINVWLTYGQFEIYPSGKCGFCCQYPAKIVEHQLFRKYSHQPSHLRTFYAWLAQQIKIKDLFYQETFYPMTYDLALTMPMMEMVGGRHKFVSDILYIYNEQTPLNDHKVSKILQAKLAQLIRNLPRYSLLSCSYENSWFSLAGAQADCLVISADHPDQLCMLLGSLERYAQNVASSTIFYYASNKKMAYKYQDLSTQFTRFKFVKTGNKDMRGQLSKALQLCAQEHVVLLSDSFLLMNEINFNECIRLLEETGAYGMHLMHGAQDVHKPVGVELGCGAIAGVAESIFAWRYLYGSADWDCFEAACLYRKKDLIKVMDKCIFNNETNALVFHDDGIMTREVGICYELARAGKMNRSEILHEFTMTTVHTSQAIDEVVLTSSVTRKKRKCRAICELAYCKKT